MKNKLLCLALSMLSVSLFFSPEAFSQDTVVRVVPTPLKSPRVGDKFIVDIVIENGRNVAGYQVMLEFEYPAIKYVGIYQGDYLSTDAFLTEPNFIGGNGIIFFAATMSPHERNGNGTLATLIFEINKVTPSTFRLIAGAPSKPRHGTILSDKDVKLSFPRTENAEMFRGDSAFDLVVESPRVSGPDLVIESVRAEPSTVAPGANFKLYATLKNQGTEQSSATTLRYYRSPDAVISTEDTPLGRASRDPLAANGTIRRYLNVTAPTTPGTYYYGACVESVPDESVADNNCSSAVSVTVTAPPVVSEDVNEDGVVDVQDLVYVAQRYGQTGTTTADVNDDGVVNIDDLILVAAVLDADAAAAPFLHSGALDLFTVADVKLWLFQAHQRDLTDPSVQRGILFLEQLLASMVPKETALLANYPNPFNPETWIPYQLAKPADVTLTIHDIHGRVVRDLDFGHQRAGVYQSKSRAAYWDGKNAQGEPVASGVYFYTLTAGDFTATRKMLIRK